MNYALASANLPCMRLSLALHGVPCPQPPCTPQQHQERSLSHQYGPHAPQNNTKIHIHVYVKIKLNTFSSCVIIYLCHFVGPGAVSDRTQELLEALCSGVTSSGPHDDKHQKQTVNMFYIYKK